METTGTLEVQHKITGAGKPYAIVKVDGKIVGSDWNGAVKGFNSGDTVTVTSEKNAKNDYYTVKGVVRANGASPNVVEGPPSPPQPTPAPSSSTRYFDPRVARMNVLGHAVDLVNASCLDDKIKKSSKVRLALVYQMAQSMEKYVDTGAIDEGDKMLAGDIKGE